jgi:hypothetical protein
MSDLTLALQWSIERNDLKARLKRQELLIATLQQENRLLRVRAGDRSDFDLDADRPAMVRMQAD